MRHKARYIRAKRALYSSVIFLCCVFTHAYGYAQETEKKYSSASVQAALPTLLQPRD